MGLQDRLDQPIGSLSGGQRQALTLLMATWMRPKVLLLDVHTTALDPKSADVVIRLSDKIVASDRLTAVMVTHSMAQAANLGTRLVMMHRGQVIHDFTGAEKRRLRARRAHRPDGDGRPGLPAGERSQRPGHAERPAAAAVVTFGRGELPGDAWPSFRPPGRSVRLSRRQRKGGTQRVAWPSTQLNE